MSDKTIGFIGGGRVTRIFLEGWRRANALPANILVSDSNAESFGILTTRFPSIRTTADCRAAAAQDFVFLGLTPAEVMDRIPVKPLAEMEPQVKEMYRTRLSALYQKIKP